MGEHKTMVNTTFTIASGLPLNQAAKKLAELETSGAGPVLSVVESPQRSIAVWYSLTSAAALFLGLLAYGLIAMASAEVDWRWLVGLPGFLLGLALLIAGAREYYSLIGINQVAHLFFSSEGNLISFVQNWWSQETNALVYLVPKKPFPCSFQVGKFTTKGEAGDSALRVDFRLTGWMKFIISPEQPAASVGSWLRKNQATALTTSTKPVEIIRKCLDVFPALIEDRIHSVMAPLVEEQGYAYWRQGPNFDIEGAVGAVNAALCKLDLPVCFMELRIQAVIPPAEVAQAEAEAKVLAAERQKRQKKLEEQITGVEWKDIPALRQVIKDTDFLPVGFQALQARLDKRARELGTEYFKAAISIMTLVNSGLVKYEIDNSGLHQDMINGFLDAHAAKVNELCQLAAVVHQGRVDERVEQVNVQLDTMLAVTDPTSPQAPKLRILAERQRTNPELMGVALVADKLVSAAAAEVAPPASATGPDMAHTNGNGTHSEVPPPADSKQAELGLALEVAGAAGPDASQQRPQVRGSRSKK